MKTIQKLSETNYKILTGNKLKNIKGGGGLRTLPGQ
jgi:hypothetical protein